MFKDIKYLLAYSIPIVTIISISQRGIWSYATVFYAFVLIPILEIILEDRQVSYSEKEVEERKINALFDWLLYGNIPMIFALLMWGLWDLSNGIYQTHEMIGKVLSLESCWRLMELM